MSAGGGGERGTYFISGSYFDEQSTIIGNETQRFSLRSRNTAQITSKMDIDLSHVLLGDHSYVGTDLL